MATSILAKAQRRLHGGWCDLGFEPFRYEHYGVHGFLADVRNYSCVPPLSRARGKPDDFDDLAFLDGLHDVSWLSVRELVEADYDREFEDRRCVVLWPNGIRDGGGTCAPGDGKRLRLRDFLGPSFFQSLETLQHIGAERVVLGFGS